MDLLEELTIAFMTRMDGMQYVFNPSTGEVLIDPLDPFDDEDGIDWEDESAEDLLVVPQITSSEGYKLRETFAGQLADERERTDLLMSLDRKKPFHHFRVQLERLGLEKDWYEFEAAYVKQRVLEWLDEVGVTIEE